MLDVAMKGGLNIPKDLFVPLLCVPDYCLTWFGIKLEKPGYHTVTLLMKTHCCLNNQSVYVLEVREFLGRTVVQSDLKSMFEDKCV